MSNSDDENVTGPFYDVSVRISLSDPVKIGTGNKAEIPKKSRKKIRESTRSYTRKFGIEGLSCSNVSVLAEKMKIDLKFERVKESDLHSNQHSFLEYFSGLTRGKMITGETEYIAPYEFKSHSLKTKRGNPYIIKKK